VIDSCQCESPERSLHLTTELGDSVVSSGVHLVLSDGIGIMVKLVVGDLADLNATELLANELIDLGCLADQFVFLTNRSPVFAKRERSGPSLYQVHKIESLLVLAVREPKYYNGGLKDHRVIKREAAARIMQFDHYNQESPSLSIDRNLLRNRPLILLHLHNRSDEALAQVKSLVKFSQNQVRVIDIPNW
jgi:hypothetical protein